jgi:hypothetical protein
MQLHTLRDDRDFSAFGQGVACIDDQVQQSGLEAGGIDQRWMQSVFQTDIEVDGRVARTAQYRFEIGDQFVQIGILCLQRLTPCE